MDDADRKLPCDVLVAPATIIRAGCTMGTLNTAIRQRRSFPGPVKFKDYPIGEFEGAIKSEARQRALLEAVEIVRNLKASAPSPFGWPEVAAQAIERAAATEPQGD